LIAMTWGELGRAAWLVAGAAALPVIISAPRSIRLPPAHRRCLAAAGAVLVAGGYVAINVYSVDNRWIEWLGNAGSTTAGSLTRHAAIAATLVMPMLTLALGLWCRTRMLLALGAVFAAASLITLRAYHPIGPWWLVLLACGASCLA